MPSGPAAAGNERLSTEVPWADGAPGTGVARPDMPVALPLEQSDAIRAQLEQTAMRAELIALDGEKRQIRARLNAIARSRQRRALAEPLALRPVPPVTTADAASLAERARTRNPLIQARLAASPQRRRTVTSPSAPLPRPDRRVSPSQMGSASQPGA